MGGNTLEFFVKMRDMMSSGLVKMAATAKKTFDNVQKSANQVTGRNKVLGQSFDEIARKITQAEATIRSSTIPAQIREARQELERLQKIQTKHPGNIDRNAKNATPSSGGGFLRNYIAPVAIATALTAGVGTVFSAGAKREQDIVGLRTFLGKGAEGAYTNIQKDAAATPFNTESLLNVNRALITTGLSAETARKDTMNLANAIAASGKGDAELERMAANMQQIKNIGKATAVDIKQFGIAGINIYGALAAATGKPIEKVKEMEVSYELLTYALDKAAQKGGIFSGALEAQSKTVMGRWSTFVDTIDMGAADMGEALQPLMHGLLDIGMAMTTKLVPASVKGIKSMIQAYGDLKYAIWDNQNVIIAAGAIIAAGGIGYLAYSGAITTAAVASKAFFISTIASLKAFSIALLSNPLTWWVVGIAAAVAGLILLYKNVEAVRNAVDGMIGVFNNFQKTRNDALNKDKIYAYQEETKELNRLSDSLEKNLKITKQAAGIRAGEIEREAITKRLELLRMAEKAKELDVSGIKEKFKGEKIQLVAEYSNLKALPKDNLLKQIALQKQRLEAVNKFSEKFAPKDSVDKTNLKSPVVDEVAEKITSGGPRVININGVKFAENFNIDIVANKLDDSLDKLQEKVEPIMQEMFLRILNSGAALQ